MTTLTAKEIDKANEVYNEQEHLIYNALRVLKRGPDAEEYDDEETAFITPYGVAVRVSGFNFIQHVDFETGVWTWEVSAGSVSAYPVTSKTKKGGLRKLLKKQAERLAELSEKAKESLAKQGY